MNWLYKLERKYRRFGIDHLMIYITATMLAVYLMDAFLGVGISRYIYFSRDLMMQGQVWRLITFIFLPPSAQPIFLLFALYFYYFVGESLENAWGSFSFTVYYLCGMIGTILAGLLTGYATNSYLNLSLFFAFAQLFPDVEVRLFFLIPIKVKWLGFANWVLFAISLIQALIRLDFATCASLIVSVLNFLLFFGPDFWNRIKTWKKYSKQRRNFRRNIKGNDQYW